MAKGSFILEGSTGKVGSLVVQRRKGSTILKEYVKPSNPKTQRQIAQRIIFATVQQAAKFMKPIIDHSFEGLAVGQDSINRFAKINLDRLRGYSVIDFAEATSAANSKCFMTTKGISALIPNKYIISTGSLQLNPASKNKYIESGGVNLVNPFDVDNSINYQAQGTTLGDVMQALFGITKAGQQITKCYILCNNVNNAYVFNNDPSSPGFVIAGARFLAMRLVVKADAAFGTDVTAMTSQQIQAAILGAFDSTKSDAVLLSWIEDALAVADGAVNIENGEDLTAALDTNEFVAAETTILSELSGSTWRRSNSEMSLLNPPTSTLNYGLYWNTAIQAWQQSSVNAEAEQFLDEGGSQNQVG